MEYGSTPYVGMAPERHGVSIKCVQNDMFITLLLAWSRANMNPSLPVILKRCHQYPDC